MATKDESAGRLELRLEDLRAMKDTPRAVDIRRRVLDAMEKPYTAWDYPKRIDDRFMSEPLPVRKSRAIALKLSKMPTDMWDSQLLAGSMVMEHTRLHAGRGFPDYTSEAEREEADRRSSLKPTLTSTQPRAISRADAPPCMLRSGGQ